MDTHPFESPFGPSMKGCASRPARPNVLLLPIGLRRKACTPWKSFSRNFSSQTAGGVAPRIRTFTCSGSSNKSPSPECASIHRCLARGGMDDLRRLGSVVMRGLIHFLKRHFAGDVTHLLTNVVASRARRKSLQLRREISRRLAFQPRTSDLVVERAMA